MREKLTDLELEAVHLRGRVAELERIVKAQEDELGKLRGHDGLSERERRILNMWPRFEDGGECAWLGDGYIDTDGDENAVCGVMLDGECANLIGREGFHTGFNEGERVERPAPEVLDADGVPIRVGDTVWSKDGCEAVVTKVERDRVFTGFEDMFCTPYEPSDLTHREPDSWEKLECDVANASCPDVYCANHHIDSSGASFEWAMASDIIRRAKKLAGVAE